MESGATRESSARDRITAYVAARGVARMSEIRDALGLSSGTVSGSLNWLVSQERLSRPARGVYAIPGTSPVIPPSLMARPGAASTLRNSWQAWRDRTVS